MSKDNDKFQAVLKMLYRVAQASEHIGSKAIAGYAHDEQIVWPFIENQFYRDACIRTAQYRGERALPGCSSPA